MKTTITLKGHKITVETEPTKLEVSEKEPVGLVGKDIDTHCSILIDITGALSKNEKIDQDIISIIQQ